MNTNKKINFFVKSDDSKEYDNIDISQEDIDRANMARKARKNKKLPTSVALEENDILELKKLAAFQGIPYQVLMRSFIKEGIYRARSKIAV